MAERGIRIRIVQRGGFAGIVPLVDVDGRDFSGSQADVLDAAATELAQLAAVGKQSEPLGADLASYAVEVERGGSTECFELREGRAETVSIGAIVARLRRLSAR